MVQTIFSGLHDISCDIESTGAGEGINGKPPGPQLPIALEELTRIWDGTLDGTPGFEVFKYVSTDACITDCSIVLCGTEMCNGLGHCFYYVHGCVPFKWMYAWSADGCNGAYRHPNEEGHQLVADYVEMLTMG